MGWKWSVASERHGIPIGWAIDGANRNDARLLESTLDAVASTGLLVDIGTMHLDRRYEIHRWLREDAGNRAIQSIHGVGRTIAAIFVAEIGDMSRFPSPRHLCSWAGLTPKHIESDTKVIRGRVTRMASALVRWAATEAVVRYQGGPAISGAYRRIAERRGRKIARVAATRKLLTLVFYGLRDGRIHSLKEAAA